MRRDKRCLSAEAWESAHWGSSSRYGARPSRSRSPLLNTFIPPHDSPGIEYHDHPQFTDEETEIQRGEQQLVRGTVSTGGESEPQATGLKPRAHDQGRVFMEDQDQGVKASSLTFSPQPTLLPSIPRLFQELVWTRLSQALSHGSHGWGEGLCHGVQH